jgi:hypothetical protein
VFYAFAMGHNATETLIASLAPLRGLEHREFSGVELLGPTERLRRNQTDDGLSIASSARGPASTQWRSKSSLFWRSKKREQTNRRGPGIYCVLRWTRVSAASIRGLKKVVLLEPGRFSLQGANERLEILTRRRWGFWS